MEDAEFDSFVASARAEFEAKQDELTRCYGFGTFERWSLDLESQKLRFSNSAGAPAVEADVIAIGSFSSRSSSWKWGWSSEQLPASARERALPLKELAAVTGFDLFANPAAFQVADEEMAWELTAMAVRHLGALGAYRAPSAGKPLVTFVAVVAVTEIAP